MPLPDNIASKSALDMTTLSKKAFLDYMHHSGDTGGSVLLYDVRKLGGSSLNRLNLRSRERVNEVRWQPEAVLTATQLYQASSRMGRCSAPTHAQVRPSELMSSLCYAICRKLANPILECILKLSHEHRAMNNMNCQDIPCRTLLIYVRLTHML